MKRPEDPASYIPARCQTLAVPAACSVHHREGCAWLAMWETRPSPFDPFWSCQALLVARPIPPPGQLAEAGRPWELPRAWHPLPTGEA